MENKELENSQESQGNETWRRNVRVAIYGMAGIYLLSLAYNMFHAIERSRGNTQLIMIVATVLFTIAGLGMVIFCATVTYKNAKEIYRIMRNTETEEDTNN